MGSTVSALVANCAKISPGKVSCVARSIPGTIRGIQWNRTREEVAANPVNVWVRENVLRVISPPALPAAPGAAAKRAKEALPITVPARNVASMMAKP